MADGNWSRIILDGHVDLATYRYLYFGVMVLVYVLILGSNSTVVLVIWRHKQLHQPMYAFIAALLVNCLLYSSSVYPKLLLDFLSQTQTVSYPVCLLQFFAFYCVGSSELLLLAAMAFDRYVSICRPLRYGAIMRPRTVAVLLAASWLLPAAHVAITTSLSARARLCRRRLDAIFCNNTIYRLQCTPSVLISAFGVVSLLDLVVLPALFIAFTYGRILAVVSGGGREVRRKAADTCLPHLLVLANLSGLVVYDVSAARWKAPARRTARLVMMLQLVLYHPLANPLIYGLKMKEIFKYVRRLFRSAQRPSCCHL
ncbi:uncharacterized protein V6R79_018468 [Siganus canaliculatus]